MQVLTIILLAFCVLYVNAGPSDAKVRRGFNNNGYGDRGGSDRGGGRYARGSDEREDGECRSGDNDENRETAYGRDGYNSDDKQHGARRATEPRFK